MLLLPTFVLVLAGFSSAVRIDLSRDAKGEPSFEAELEHLHHKYYALSKLHHNKTGEHLNVLNLDLFNKQKRAHGKTHLRKAKAWSGHIEVGFPPQKTTAVFDTGSADLVFDKSDYNPKKSLTSKNLHKTFDFDYYDRHVEGDLYADRVAIGGVKAWNVAVGHGKDDYNKDVCGATFGLSFSTTTRSFFDVEQDAFIWAAKKQHLIQSSTYQFTLRPNGKASLNVGNVDFSELNSLIHWSNKNTDKTFWRADVKLNGHSIKNAILDTGTSIIVGPNEEVGKFLKKLDGIKVEQGDDGLYHGTYDCKNPPRMEFEVFGKKLVFPEAAMQQGYVGDTCTFAMVGSKVINDWILGSPFFEIGSFILNYDLRHMGVAQFT